MAFSISFTCLNTWSRRSIGILLKSPPRFIPTYSSIILFQFIILIAISTGYCVGQTASTGALTGQVLDLSGRAIVHASVRASNAGMAVSRSTISDEEGRFVLPLLPPGTYQLTVAKDAYSQGQSLTVQIPVTETIRVSVPMKVAGITQNLEVEANVSQLQVDSIALGRV